MNLLRYEIQFGYPESLIAGVDEVGRGCLAGPVVACAVILPPRINPEELPWIKQVNDSKLLSPALRQELSFLLRQWLFDFCIGSASCIEIDSLNILQASHLAMLRALQGLSQKPHWTLVDGHLLPRGIHESATAIVKGDQKSLSIAAASIIAKVARDRLMEEESTNYPHYGFEIHKGYPTALHRERLKTHGPSAFHRKSFRPVTEAIGLQHAMAKQDAPDTL